jgi:hypothetical protein
MVKMLPSLWYLAESCQWIWTKVELFLSLVLMDKMSPSLQYLGESCHRRWTKVGELFLSLVSIYKMLPSLHYFAESCQWRWAKVGELFLGLMSMDKMSPSLRYLAESCQWRWTKVGEMFLATLPFSLSQSQSSELMMATLSSKQTLLFLFSIIILLSTNISLLLFYIKERYPRVNVIKLFSFFTDDEVQ